MTRRSLAARAAVLALLIQAVPAAAVDPNFRVYADEFPLTPLTRLIRGVDAGMGTPISSLTVSPSYANGAELAAGTVWDFQGLTGADRTVQFAPIATGWSCYIPESAVIIEDPPCGFDLVDNDLLFVQDRPDTGGRDALALDYDDNGTFWLRAWTIDEGNTPSTGDQELRLCFRPQGNRKEVPFVVFGNVDPIDMTRRYMTAGDPPWQSELFDCGAFSNNVVVATQGAPCGTGGGTNAALTDDGGTQGRFSGRVTSAGTLTLPSGHVLDSILVEILASFEARLVVLCLGANEVTTQYQLVWFVPGYGPIIQIRSPSDQGTDLTTWTTVSSTVVGHGLLPPLSAQVDAVDGSSITVSWDPGLVPSVIDGYEVHWGTQPGAMGAPPFSSGFLPAAAGTSYAINGLAPDTDYWVSVTTLADYTDPRSGVTTTYRSLAMPETIGADIDGDGVQDTSYPPEVTARTLATPSAALAINRATTLDGTGATPPVASAFACVNPPHRICIDQTVAGSLGSLVVMGDGAVAGANALWLYEHSDATGTMMVRRTGNDLSFLPN